MACGRLHTHTRLLAWWLAGWRWRAQMHRKQPFPMIFMDCNMPVCNGANQSPVDVVDSRRWLLRVCFSVWLCAGFEATRLIRDWEAETGAQAPVVIVACTGDDLTEVKDLYQSTGSSLMCQVWCKRGCVCVFVFGWQA